MNFSLPENVAIIGAVVTAALTLALFAVALGLRFLHEVQKRRLQGLRDDWWPVFAETAASEQFADDVVLPVLGVGQKLILLREWSRFRTLVQGKATIRLNSLAARLNLLPLARRLMRKHSVEKRLLALQVAGQLRDVDSWQAIDTLMEDPNIALSVTAATALTEIDADRAIPRIIPLVGRYARWPRTQVGRILNRAGPDIVSTSLCREITAATADDAIRLLQFADSAFAGDVNAVVEQLLKSREEPAVLSAALKAARGRVCPERVLELTHHEAWYVRMHAASLLGRAGSREDLAVLEPLLGDREWWVRYRVAQALVLSPYLGPNALRRIADRQQDRFACDILRQAMAEMGLE